MLGKLLAPDIQEMLEAKRLRELREALILFPPLDVAELITDLSSDEQAIVFRILPRELATDVFEQLSWDNQHKLLRGFSQEQTRRIIEEMDPDDRTAFLEELPARVTRKLLRLLTPEERRITKELLAYPENSVGRRMTPDYIDLRKDMTAGEAIAFIRKVGLDRETVYACYVTRDGHILEGTVGLRRLVLAPADVPVGDIMQSPPVAVIDTHADQEEATRLIRDYDLLALPVVDKETRLVGIVTVDDLIDVMEEEATADMHVMAGVLPSTEGGYLEQRLWKIGWRRGIPLLGLVVGQLFAGIVMQSFHLHLESVIALAFFVPMVIATGGSAGVQTATLIVRDLSTGELALSDFPRLLGRELLVCLFMGLVCGGLALVLAAGMLHLGNPEDYPASAPFQVGLTVGLSMLSVMLISVVAGTLLPMLFQALKMDPAVLTSPFLTTTVDILGLIVYFLMASWIFQL